MSAHHPDPASHRSTVAGDVIGYSFTDTTHAWLGIPYATPPVGALRWRAPKPHAPWQGVKECLHFGAMSVQPKSFMTNSPPEQWNKPIGSEDCLTLNVFAPKNLPSRPLPVMVWIHGGGNTGGASSMYAIAGNLPPHHDVIVVSVNYRLGVFGWFYHPALFDDQCTPEDRSGNFGTLDLIEALRWVRDNIRTFGGDPDNVTIFGESAGGQNVLSLYVSPLAKGLFHKVIAQSPVTASVTFADGYHFHHETPAGQRGNSADVLIKLMLAEGRAKNHDDAVSKLQKMSADDIGYYLYHKDAEQIISVFNGGHAGIYESPRLFQDGVVLPDVPLLDAFGDPRFQSEAPLLIGTNRDEMKLFMMMSPEYVTMRFGKVPTMRDPKRYEIDSDYFSRMWKAVGVDEPLQRMFRLGKRNVFCYRFDWDEIPAIPFVRPDLLIGATHAMEIPFVFRDIEGRFNPFRTFTKRNQKSRIDVTKKMAQYWTNFAHNGHPNADTNAIDAGKGKQNNNALPEWNPWQPGTAANTLVIDADSEGGIRMESTDVTFETVKNALRGDKRLAKHDKDRCRLYAQMFLGSGLFGHSGSLEEYETFGKRGKAPIPAATFKSHRLI